MELRLLEYALEVFRKQSFTKAAASLRIAQPSLSQQIGKLERELGVKLFYRGRGPVTPTPDGIRFLEQAEQILRMRDDLEREMRERSEGVGRELTIGTPAITGGHVLPPLLQAYKQRFQHVHIHLVEESTEKIEDLTARGMVDISILALPVEDARLATRPMLTEPLLLALPRTECDWMQEEVRAFVRAASTKQPASPKPRRSELSLSSLSNAPFIVLKRGYGFRRIVLDLCAENGFQPQIAYETSSVETAQSLATYGLGVTLVPNMVARSDGRIHPLYATPCSRPTRTIVFAYLKERYLSLSAKALMDVYDELTRRQS